MTKVITTHGCADPACTCWYPAELRPAIKVCGGNPAPWDMAIGCEECGWQTWDWSSWAGDVCMDEMLRRFDAAHPFAFFDCHDPGDECRGLYDFDGEPPTGGWRYPSCRPAWHPDAEE